MNHGIDDVLKVAFKILTWLFAGGLGAGVYWAYDTPTAVAPLVADASTSPAGDVGLPDLPSQTTAVAP